MGVEPVLLNMVYWFRKDKKNFTDGSSFSAWMGKRASYFATTKRAPGKKNMCLHASGTISFQINKICF